MKGRGAGKAYTCSVTAPQEDPFATRGQSSHLAYDRSQMTPSYITIQYPGSDASGNILATSLPLSDLWHVEMSIKELKGQKVASFRIPVDDQRDQSLYYRVVNAGGWTGTLESLRGGAKSHRTVSILLPPKSTISLGEGERDRGEWDATIGFSILPFSTRGVI